MLNYENSPLTHKQKQINEFKMNIKAGKITKHGIKEEDKIKVPILNQKLRNRIQNSKYLAKNATSSR